MMGRKQGFTLIELLVVIAIIAILAAILFPVFVSVKIKAHQSSCLSNVRQLALAFGRYCNDYNGRFCAYAIPTENPGRFGVYWYYWFENVQPYVKNQKVFICPARPKGEFSPYYLGYGFNAYYLGSNYAPTPGSGGTLESTIRTPSKTVFLADSRGRRTKPIDAPRMMGPYGPYIYSDIAFPVGIVGSEEETYMVSDCHNGGANVAWCDGHAGWMAKKKLAYDVDLWNPDKAK